MSIEIKTTNNLNNYISQPDLSTDCAKYQDLSTDCTKHYINLNNKNDIGNVLSSYPLTVSNSSLTISSDGTWNSLDSFDYLTNEKEKKNEKDRKIDVLIAFNKLNKILYNKGHFIDFNENTKLDNTDTFYILNLIANLWNDFDEKEKTQINEIFEKLYKNLGE